MFLPILLFYLSSVLCERKVSIIGTNDIHGKAFPTVLSLSTGEKYNYGGLVYMASLIDIIKKENPGNTLYFDAGDEFQGGIQSSKLISSGEIMDEFFNLLKLDGSSLGNHEFDFGPAFLFNYLKKKNSPNLAANLRSEKGEKNFLEKQKGSQIYTLDNGIKIGVIGLSTTQTPRTTAGFGSGKNKFPKYRFLDYKDVVIDESKKLRTLGVNAVLIVSHVGDACEAGSTYGIWTKKTPQKPCPNDQITRFINQLPKGTIDGIVQGHRHRFAHHYVKGIPYMGTIKGGYYMNVLYLSFSDEGKLLNSKIEGPIPVCEKRFQNTKRCNYLKPEEEGSAGSLVNWQFHKKDVQAYQPLNKLYQEKWLPLMKPYLEELAINEVELRKVEDRESPIANLFTTLMHKAVPDADFVIMNPGGFRSQWMPGVIQYQHFYNMFPFENQIYSFELTGSQLLQTLKVIQSGKKGFYQAWNLQMHVTLDGNKMGFTSATFINGSKIEPTKIYKGVTIDFLLNGGDDFKDVIGIVFTPKNKVRVGEFRSTIKPYLIDLKVIKKQDLIKPDSPRLIVN